MAKIPFFRLIAEPCGENSFPVEGSGGFRFKVALSVGKGTDFPESVFLWWKEEEGLQRKFEKYFAIFQFFCKTADSAPSFSFSPLDFID